MTGPAPWIGNADPAATEAELRQPETLLTLPEQIADEIGGGIIAGRYAPGERLVQEDLADTFKVSRGPVRDALHLLERRGMVEFLPRRGAFVRTPSLDAVADAFSIRIALGGLAARTLAVSHAREDIERLRQLRAALPDDAASPDEAAVATAMLTARLGREIVRRGGNALLEEMMENLGRQIAFTLVWRQPLDFVTPERRRDQAVQLDRIVDAIERGEPDRAEILLRRSWEEWRDNAIAALSARRHESVSPAKLFRSA